MIMWSGLGGNWSEDHLWSETGGEWLEDHVWSGTIGPCVELGWRFMAGRQWLVDCLRSEAGGQ